jgi:poly-gamma-glutamate synthesis protein (capsule biosynthesis protein)
MHGPHVVQPVELVNGTWVFWSLGNFVSEMGGPGATRYGPPTRDGLLARARFEETAPGRFATSVDAVLICNEVTSRTVYPSLETLSRADIDPDLRLQLEACVVRTRPVVPHPSVAPTPGNEAAR